MKFKYKVGDKVKYQEVIAHFHNCSECGHEVDDEDEIVIREGIIEKATMEECLIPQSFNVVEDIITNADGSRSISQHIGDVQVSDNRRPFYKINGKSVSESDIIENI